MNTTMLGDPLSARCITADRKPVTETMIGWRNAVVMAGTLVAARRGMFAVEEKDKRRNSSDGSGRGIPPVWPGLEVGWGVTREFRGKGYAVEAARASIDWSFATFEIPRDRSTASIAKTPRRRPWRGGSVLHQEGEIESVRPCLRMCG